MTNREKLNRFAHYFGKLLNETEIVEGKIKYDLEDDEENTAIVKTREVEEDIQQLKNTRSTGENNIPAEILKNCGQKLTTRIWNGIVKICEEEKMSAE